MVALEVIEIMFLVIIITFCGSFFFSLFFSLFCFFSAAFTLVWLKLYPPCTFSKLFFLKSCLSFSLCPSQCSGLSLTLVFSFLFLQVVEFGKFWLADTLLRVI